MAFGKYPDRTVLVELGRTRSFSDVVGRNVVRISDGVAQRQNLADRLRTAGCAVKTEDRIDWHTAGDFMGADEPPDLGSANAGQEGVLSSPAREGSSTTVATPETVSLPDASNPRLELLPPTQYPTGTTNGWVYYSLQLTWVNDVPTAAYEVEGTIDFVQRHSSRSRGKTVACFSWMENGERKFAGRMKLNRPQVVDLLLIYTKGDCRFGVATSQTPDITDANLLDCGEWFCLVKVTATNAKTLFTCCRILIPDDPGEHAEVVWKEPMWNEQSGWHHHCSFCTHSFTTPADFDEHLLRNH